MEDYIKVESISMLNTMFQYGPPKHPLISIIDFSKVDFEKLGLLDQ